jgi:putative transposase
MPSSFTHLPHHFIWGTKNRVPLIADEIQPRLYEFLGGIARANACTLIGAGGVENHVHLLILMAPTICVADLARELKANSSRWMRETVALDFSWQRGYAAYGVSESVVDTVKAYLANQREHHRTTSFEEEYVAFLERHKVPYDPRYLWD